MSLAIRLSGMGILAETAIKGNYAEPRDVWYSTSRLVSGPEI